jgi:DNA-binding NtrC family response regulator
VLYERAIKLFYQIQSQENLARDGKIVSEKARILIVDDEESIRKVLATILEDEGYIVESVETAKKGIEKSENSFHNVALIDIRLPDMVGVELLAKMRETKPRMRKIIITGYPTLENAVAAVNRGADAYILKPFDVEKMLATIREQLQLQNEERKFSQQKVAEFIETRVKELETIDQQVVKKSF